MKASEIEQLFDRLWPICRSITGDGLRESFSILSEVIPFELTEIASGTPVFDWVIPKEWNIRDAYILTPEGKKIAWFRENNLHVVNYSVPVRAEMSFEELLPHLHSLPEMPDAVPYVTSYYKENWGFCLDYHTLSSLPKEGIYTVIVDSDLSPGHLTYGQYLLKGESDREILFSSYLCHPSMANNELSGPLVMSALYQLISSIPNRHYSYRFVLAPETIGIIAFLHKYGQHLLSNLDAGYVLTCCGDSGKIHYKRSRRISGLADRAAEHVLSYAGEDWLAEPFSVGGSDERQYCSPGFNLPVGSIMRTPYQRYPEYHTSLDNKSRVSFPAMEKTASICLDIVRTLEMNGPYENEVLFCEPHMGKHGLYPSSALPTIQRKAVHDLMHFLNYADGTHDLIETAKLRNCPVWDFEDHIARCLEKGLVRRV